jgi:hypothetical protein
LRVREYRGATGARSVAEDRLAERVGKDLGKIEVGLRATEMIGNIRMSVPGRFCCKSRRSKAFAIAATF